MQQIKLVFIQLIRAERHLQDHQIQSFNFTDEKMRVQRVQVTGSKS